MTTVCSSAIGCQVQLALEFSAPERLSSFTDGLRAFHYRNRQTEVADRNGVPYFINEFWTSGQRKANRLHEISYRACFKPQLPAFFIERLTRPGDAVYDPFMGRGTTPLQAALMGRLPVGNDINPLSAMLLRPRLSPPPMEAIAARLADIPPSGALPDNPLLSDLRAFFHKTVLARLISLRTRFIERESGGALDEVDDWLRMVCLNRLTGHSPGFFSVYTMPPNQAVSADRQRQINMKRGQSPPPRDVDALILRKSRALLSMGQPKHPSALLGTAPAEHAEFVPDGSVNLVVTSPPFLDVVNYWADNWLRCWFGGIDLGTVPITAHKTPEAWEKFVRASLKDITRTLRPGGFLAFEVGEVRDGKVLLEDHVIAAARGLPLTVVGVMVNDQNFTKTANCWGVRNNHKGTNTNRIVLIWRNE
ncbi:MAG: hypothetical protein M2R45_01431 [Verrucomicrobia subdivision 3 bacterium]|nr:hypothetical protein [Limisphaerales bacterium]MCS1417623.1 hypothetical protein [Limisphaerales bacterium]